MNYAEMIRNAMAKLEALLNQAKAEQRDLTDEEQTVFDSLETDVQKWQNALEKEKRIQAIKDSLETPVTDIQRTGIMDNIKVGNNRIVNKPWDSFGEFLVAVRNADDPSRRRLDPRLMPGPENSTGLSVAVGADGGFMIQQQFVQKLMDSMAAKSTVFNRITRIPIGPDSNGITLPALAETSRATGSRFGGVVAYWAIEGGTVASSKPKIRDINLKLEKLLAFCYMTEELLRDSSAMEAFVLKAYADEMAFVIDNSIFNGTGVGLPLGVLNSPGLVTVAKRAGQAADTVVWENIVDMWCRLSPAAQTRAVFYINQEVQSELMTMAQSVGTGGVPVFLPSGGASASPYMTLMGRPVIPVEQLSALGDVGDIVLADMSDYIGIDKGQIQTDTSIHVQYLYDEMVYRFRYRFNGTPYTNSALTPFKGTKTISNYVTLAARA